jgi:Holliday junction resolvase RusA-like endonuclease
MDASTTQNNGTEQQSFAEGASCILGRQRSVAMTIEKNLDFGKKIEFAVYGKVIGKGRPHFVRKTGVAITPQATRSYESVLRDAARHELDEHHTPWTGMFVAIVSAEFAIPKSWNKKKKELAQRQLIAPAKPDADNLGKILLDSLNRVVYEDDQACVLLVVTKEWAERDCLRVLIGEL